MASCSVVPPVSVVGPVVVRQRRRSVRQTRLGAATASARLLILGVVLAAESLTGQTWTLLDGREWRRTGESILTPLADIVAAAPDSCTRISDFFDSGADGTRYGAMGWSWSLRYICA